jgi:hypothetical protein
MVKKQTKGKVVKQPTPKKKEEVKKIPGTDAFKNALVTHLKDYARQDKLFLKKLQNPKKNINDCMTFIMNQAKKDAQNGVAGYHDDDVYKMARHYYDEDDIEVGEPITSARIAVNQQIALSPEEVEKAKQKAREKVVAEEMARMRKKPASKKDTNLTKAAELIQKKEEEEMKAPETQQGSLF